MPYFRWGASMHRLIAFAFILGPAVFVTGCNEAVVNSTAPYKLPSASTPSTKSMPPEYRTLAEQLSIELKSNPKEFRDGQETAEIIAEIHTVVLALQGIESADKEIAYISAQAASVAAELLQRFERVITLPMPPGAGEVLMRSFIGGFYSGATGDPRGFAGAAAHNADAQAKQDAIVGEMYQLLAATEKLEAARLLLPKVAEEYSATFCDSTDRITLDFDEAWGWTDSHDWLSIHNRGSAIDDCTIVVQLTGTTGEVARNVHYVRKLPAKAWMYARYEHGTELLGKHVERTTVPGVQKVDVTVYSPQFATLITYNYPGAEKDKDVAKRCKDLRFTGSYQPFESGVLWNTYRGIEITLDGVPLIPQCRVDVTFRNNANSKTWYWDLDSWKKGEAKSFTPPKGGLTFEPSNIDMSVSFAGTEYRSNFTFQVSR